MCSCEKSCSRVYASLLVILHFSTAALRLTAAGGEQLLTDDLYYAKEFSQVNLECFGSGNLEWTSSTGFDIPLDELGEIHQSYDHTRDALSLVIANFTSDHTAVYTCTTDLTDDYDRQIALSILITNCELMPNEWTINFLLIHAI